MIRLVDVYSVNDPLRFLYQLLAERPAEANISHAAMPSFDEHVRFVDSKPYYAWFLIETKKGERVGAINVTNNNEIGIAIAKDHQSKGYGAAAIRQLLATVKPLPALKSVRRGTFIANVAPTNTGSMRFFARLGPLIQHTYEVKGGQDGKRDAHEKA